jgi:putative DNA primase/helicase
LKNSVELTEDGIAEEFAKRHQPDLRFDHERGRWFKWTGAHWEMDKIGFPFDEARRLSRQLREGNKKMASKVAIQGVEYMARSDPRLAVKSDVWDKDPFLLGTPAGAVNLKTGELAGPKREQYITRLTAVAPAPKGAACPKFMGFLMQATNHDALLCRFLQQWAGYCLTGVTAEQSLLFVYGPGGNGKTVFVNVLFEIMGDYSKSATMQTFTASKQQRHLTEIAMLQGARLVTASETEKGQEWSESRINSLTGSEPITANYMRQDHFTFVPQFKLTLIGNHTPKLGSVNEAARRRFNIVPFTYKPKPADPGLPEALKAEYPAILRWMIEGCLDWQASGLTRPKIVLDATAEYFEEQDVIGRWIEECCALGADKKATASTLFASFKAFTQAVNEPAGSQMTFAAALAQHGYQKSKSNGLSVYKGIAPKLTLGSFSSQM